MVEEWALKIRAMVERETKGPEIDCRRTMVHLVQMDRDKAVMRPGRMRLVTYGISGRHHGCCREGEPMTWEVDVLEPEDPEEADHREEGTSEEKKVEEEEEAAAKEPKRSKGKKKNNRNRRRR